jgi:hypothetical protein
VKPEEERATLFRRALRTDFRVFAQKAFATASGAELSEDPYIEVICKAAVDVFNGTVRRLVLNLPPRHGKTLIFTVALCAWELAHRPNAKIMALSYDRDLARLIATKVRDVLCAPWFKNAFPKTKLRPGHNRAVDFATTKGGALFANQIESGVTGHGADLIVIDDPSDISDAEAPDRPEKVSDIYDNVISNRRQPQYRPHRYCWASNSCARSERPC